MKIGVIFVWVYIMRIWIVLGLANWVVSWAGGVSIYEVQGRYGDSSPVIYYDAARHSLVLGPVERGGDVVEVLNVIGQRVAVFTVSEPVSEHQRMVTLALPTLPSGLYYARWLQNGQIYQVRRFSLT